MRNPYKIETTDEWDYSFITKHNIIYRAYFIDASVYHDTFCNAYLFNIDAESDAPRPIDSRFADTVFEILNRFFCKKDRAMIMVCDNSDGKEEKRMHLFTKWFLRYNDGYYAKYDAHVYSDDGYQLYVSMILHTTHPLRHEVIAAFYDVVQNNFYPLS